MTTTQNLSPRLGTEWAGVALDVRTGQTIRKNENGVWITNAEWLSEQ
jgi:hypothetical protein